MSADGFEQRFQKKKPFGDDNDHVFGRPMATAQAL